MNPFCKMLIDALRADAIRHEGGDFSELGCEADAVEVYLSKHFDSRSSKSVAIAYDFWHSWIDQAQHGFKQNFYGVQPAAWPGMAREIADSLESGAPIVNATVLRLFDFSGS